jgi:hypothetical protein
MVNRELKKARIGLAHILMYNKKMQELREGTTNKPEEFEHFNPKGEGFIYF